MDSSIENVIKQTYTLICLQFVKEYIKNVLFYKIKTNDKQEEFKFKPDCIVFDQTVKSFVCTLNPKMDQMFFETCIKFIESEQLWMSEIENYITENPRDLFTFSFAIKTNKVTIILENK